MCLVKKIPEDQVDKNLPLLSYGVYLMHFSPITHLPVQLKQGSFLGFLITLFKYSKLLGSLLILSAVVEEDGMIKRKHYVLASQKRKITLSRDIQNDSNGKEVTLESPGQSWCAAWE